MAWKFPIFPKFIDIIMSNPTLFIGFVCILFIGILLFIFYQNVKPEKRVLYCSEGEKIGEELSVSLLTPRSIKTEGNKRFIRFSDAINFKVGRKNVTTWWGKRGTAYTFKPATTPKGKAVKIGSIWEAICGIIGEEKADKIEQTIKEQFMTSDVFVTVELERGFTPSGLPQITEEDVYTEANLGMADLIGRRIRESIHKEDWLKYGGFIAMGIASTLLLYQLGIIS